MKAIIFSICTMVFLFFLYGCTEKKQNAFRYSTDPTIDSLLSDIKKIEYSDVAALRKITTEILSNPNSENAKTIASYYSIKAAYYEHATPEVLNQLDSVYNTISKKEFEFIKLDIDLTLTNFYRFNNVPMYHKRIKLASNYIFDMQNNLDLDILINNLINYNTNELVEIIERNKLRDWDMYIANIYFRLGQAYLSSNNKQKAIDVVTVSLNRNIKFNLIDEACANINLLTNCKHDIRLQQKAIELSIKSGHTRRLGIYYTVLGHCYFDNKDYKNAVIAYGKACDQAHLNQNIMELCTYSAYFNLALIKSNKSNAKEAITGFDKTLNLIDSLDFPIKKTVLERKMWAYTAINDTINASIVRKSLVDLVYSHEDDFSYYAKMKADNANEMELTTSLRMKKKNNEIKMLVLSNDLNNALIAKQRLIIWLSVLTIFIVTGLTYYYRQRNRNSKEIAAKNTIIEKQNIELENLVHNLTKSNEMLENFAQVAAHDIKSPLRTISNFANILKMKYSSVVAPNDLSMFNFIISGCRDLTNIVNDLFLFSTLTQDLSKPEVINLKELVETTESKLHELLVNSQTTLIQETDLPNIVAHKNLILQLFLNLVSNAAKYAQKDQENLILIGTKPYNSKFCLLYVKDTGIGIEEDKLKEVFLLFRKLHPTTEFESSGIGLATCKRIVDFYQGDIWVESKLEVGSTFFFTLPLK